MPNSIAQQIVKPADLPAPPQSVIRVIEACTEVNIDAINLANIVSQDPILSVELLRITNSAYFGFSSKITSVARAITIIGHRALKNMVLCIAIRDALKPDDIPTFPIMEFWEAAIRRAVSARVLASVLSKDEDVCFTAGLIQDFGLLVLFYLNHNRISEWPNLSDLLPDERYDLERQLFGDTHDNIGLKLGSEWGLPEELIIAMGFHHGVAPVDISLDVKVVCDVVHCADWMASIYYAADKRKSILQCHEELRNYFNFSVEKVNDLLFQVAEQESEVASAFGIAIDGQHNIDLIMREANLQLANENLSYQELTWELEHTLEERDRVASELHQELELAREVQRSLLPSKLFNAQGIVGVNVSAKIVSGDFYDYFRLYTGEIAFCIADVSGKGMNASLLMAKTSSLFRCLAKSIHDPSKLMGMINREIYETSIRGMYVTMVAGIFDPVTSKVKIVNAGHLPGLVFNNNSLENEYPASGPPLGVLQDIQYCTTEFVLGRHSLYLYTDGLLEARLSNKLRLQRDGLLALLVKYKKMLPTERLQLIIADIRERSLGFDDDLTILLIEA